MVIDLYAYNTENNAVRLGWFDCQNIIIVTDGEYCTSASWMHSTWAGWYGWFTDGDEELKGITHWIPLPQMPKKVR